ncbi:MAG: hypothetical protein CNE98_00945 [Bacteroidetes bacterium MED-G17]|nr:MAG: hypothetical protein CBB99_05600 [Bacteroidetes bacterium TMED39]PDH53655.1 MAG: hypothetical protein CNE98_00945 [Bacteroidetes bacterium MED-G17]|tara:strand:+ start:5221 stop:5856 length:636 start_codon:yes stop_codon:yes gene_type:complete
MDENKIIGAYISYVLDHGEKPKSVFSFAKSLKMDEAKFYDIFSSLEHLESEILASFFNQAVQKMEEQKIFEEYNMRERFLSVCYAWVEILRNNRSYVQLTVKSSTKFMEMKGSFQNLRKSVESFGDNLVKQGVDSHEIKDRKYLSERYPNILFGSILFILNFWLNDQSKSFEKTDEAIEKSVNLAFDLMAKSTLDNLFDFGKFIYQNSSFA